MQAIYYKGISFFPFPFPQELRCISISQSILKLRCAVFISHAWSFVDANNWDSVFFNGNPKALHKIRQKSWKETKMNLQKLELFLKRIAFLSERGLLDITPSLEKGEDKQMFTKEIVLKNYLRSTKWARDWFNYEPRFLLGHFFKFFNVSKNAIMDARAKRGTLQNF
jgi:hypothetical protein